MGLDAINAVVQSSLHNAASTSAVMRLPACDSSSPSPPEHRCSNNPHASLSEQFKTRLVASSKLSAKVAPCKVVFSSATNNFLTMEFVSCQKPAFAAASRKPMGGPVEIAAPQFAHAEGKPRNFLHNVSGDNHCIGRTRTASKLKMGSKSNTSGD